MKKILISALMASASMCASADNLVILHTNDTHSQIDPADNGLGGVHRRKVLIDSVRTAHPQHTLLVDAGDIVQGSLFFNIYRGEVEEKLMNELGYDIRILGNHEFDNGMTVLAENLVTSDAELLAANYQTIGTPLEGLFIPYTIRTIDGHRIAFIPVNLQPEGMISPRNTEGLGYIDDIKAANNMAWYAKNIEQADIVVAVTHIGYTQDVKLARSSSDIDIIIGGHSHTRIDPADPSTEPHLIKNRKGRDVLVAQTGRGGERIGEIVIDLDNPGAIPSYRLITVDRRLDSRLDPAVEAIVAPYRAEVDALNSKIVGHTAKALDRTSPEMLNFAADFVAQRARELTDNVDFAILNKGGIRNSLPKGDISEGQVTSLMPFFNRIQVLDIKGDKLMETFDVMARAGGNGVSSEMEILFDPATNKCTDATLNGVRIDPAKTYRIATIDYLAQGGDYMQPLTAGTLVAESPAYLFEDMIVYLRDGKGKGKAINPPSTRRMRPM
ncbi:MAG: bifunctional metallophosphatase/5'-nucleotidase [Muribaculaceae bacterium]|nr:bifunctional metallophosphatase/5'-nucleotidase [Muribaculaceae bacterium]